MYKTKRNKHGWIWIRWARGLSAGIVMLALAASLMPVLSPAANAQDCPVGQVLDANGICVPELVEEDVNSETDQVDEEEQAPADQEDVTPLPEDGEEPLPETEPAEEAESSDLIATTPSAETGNGYVNIHKYDCGMVADAASKSLDDLLASCSPWSGIGFYLANFGYADQVSYSEQVVTDGNGLAYWIVPNPYVVHVAETLPAGYGEPIAYCGYVTNQNDPMSQYFPAEAGLDVPLAADQHFYCDWFNVLASPGETIYSSADIIIHKYDCDADPSPNPGDDIATVFQQAGCTLMDGVDFTVEGQGANFSDTRTTGADGAGTVEWFGLNTDPAYSIIEKVPAGYDTPLPYCIREVGGTTAFVHPGPAASLGFALGADDEHIECYWANIPAVETSDEEDASVTIHKYECPNVGPPVLLGRDGIESALQKAGCQTMDGIEFTLSEFGGPVLDTKLTGADGPGTVFWGLVGGQGYQVTETIPDGYGNPAVYCWVTNEDGTTPYDWQKHGPPVGLEVAPNDHFVCYWINIPEAEDGSIQINKYVCPVGYDLHAPGASPYADCTDAGNNIEFLLDGANKQITGQVLFGAVKWENLPPSAYTVSEIMPNGVASAFVMSCDGNSIPMIQGYPLSDGADFDLVLGPGDDIVCSWYNVPKAHDTGTVTVIKYACESKVFVSVDDCQIFEGGAKFALSHFNGSTREAITTGTTSANGVLSFPGLAEGLYQVDEVGGTWCHAVADRTTSDGDLVVGIGQETTVWVYNCGIQGETKQPVKYPNTGVGSQSQSQNTSFAPVLPSDAPGLLEPHQWTGVLDSRLIPPFLSGDKPVRVEIDAIGLNATIETLEIVDGAFQDPTTSDQVAWYKDTARLGEDGNVVMAGHLNYWGDPEGVFFALDQVEKGDEIAITAEDGTDYRYTVSEVSLEEANSETLQAITQESGGQTLTLITCGGEWDPAIQSYRHRTVVQAELMD